MAKKPKQWSCFRNCATNTEKNLRAGGRQGETGGGEESSLAVHLPLLFAVLFALFSNRWTDPPYIKSRPDQWEFIPRLHELSSSIPYSPALSAISTLSLTTNQNTITPATRIIPHNASAIANEP